MDLETQFNELISQLPRRIAGPQILAKTLGITTVTASRFLKAIAQPDPVATIQLLPGPNPLQRIVDAARQAGASAELCDRTTASVSEFDKLIRDVAGDRSSLKAMLTAWLPEERREFEAQRRQSIFKAFAELNGVSSDTEITSMALHPSAKGKGIDIVAIKCLLGIDRIRPDAIVHLGTQRLEPQGKESVRIPKTIRRQPAMEGLNDVRLDEFCNAPPAPTHADDLGNGVIQYTLAPTGFGPASKVDFVIGELNENELEGRKPGPERPPHFFVIPEASTRKLVFDLLVHRDVFPGCTPRAIAYDTMIRGAARAGDPTRRLDRKELPEALMSLGTDHRRLRLLEFPAYAQLREHVFHALGWNADHFRAYRVEVTYPLPGNQVVMAFEDPA
ncbi:MAG: hypothetical protein R3F17_01465 [Planctomycetota bacterium]